MEDFVPQLLLVAHHLFLVLEDSCMIRPAPAQTVTEPVRVTLSPHSHSTTTRLGHHL
ncbi:MAG TPA: hypothetical protein VE288_07540 [Rubrobacteraceae bacterium]|nr:hypothetical protein [Rubrobacteraceae bacterium]